MQNNKSLWVALIVVAIIAIGAYSFPQVQSTLSAVANRLPHGYWDTADGYYVDGTSVIDGDRATAVEGFTRGGAATTLTDANGGTYTLTQAEMLAAGTFAFAASGAGQEVIALTFPATSTMTTLIPNSGDCREWIYDASALAAATTTTLTAGTGHNIIAYTTNDDVIDGLEFSQITMCRRADTDVNTFVTEMLHAD